jgi:hypothetical protein
MQRSVKRALPVTERHDQAAKSKPPPSHAAAQSDGSTRPLQAVHIPAMAFW